MRYIRLSLTLAALLVATTAPPGSARTDPPHVNLITGECKPAVDSLPRLVRAIKPDCADSLKQAEDNLTVTVTAVVDQYGNVTQAYTEESCGQPDLDRAAVRAAYGCRWAPAYRSGSPVTTMVTYAVSFSEESDTTTTDSAVPGPDEFVPVEVFPEMVYEAVPAYPRMAEQTGASGKVWVKALVDEQGSVAQAMVGKTSGHAMLDKAALEAARKCRFKPGIQDGRPVKVWVTFPYSFEMDK